MFTTATALNTLYDIWVVKSPSGSLSWLPNTPANIVEVTTAGAEYLAKHVNQRGQSLKNVFFSGSLKGMVQMPFAYPANKLVWINGTALDPATPQGGLMDECVAAMEGVVDDDDYQEMVASQHFGWETPVEFPGFNNMEMPFPYWSSEPLTQAAALLALSRYARLQ